MEARDLRIGNFVTIDNDSAWPELKDIPMRVTALEALTDKDFTESTGSVSLEYDKETHSQYDEFIKPIPLNEEWLIKFGFEYCDDGEFDKWANAKMYYKGMIQIGSFRIEDHGHAVKNPAFLNGNPISAGSSDFVHQLQNIYYALTGTELELSAGRTFIKSPNEIGIDILKNSE